MDGRFGETQSALWCYFGWHESGLRCPPGTISWENPTFYADGSRWQSYQCNEYHQEYGRAGVLSAVAEWLFQNVSQLVIREAERQIQEAFPIPVINSTIITNPVTRVTTNQITMPTSTTVGGFQRWPGLPKSDSLITVHIRWGDKAREMKLVALEEIINGTKSLLTEDELAGRKVVHIYVATEDPQALDQFHKAAAAN